MSCDNIIDVNREPCERSSSLLTEATCPIRNGTHSSYQKLTRTVLQHSQVTGIPFAEAHHVAKGPCLAEHADKNSRGQAKWSTIRKKQVKLKAKGPASCQHHELVMFAWEDSSSHADYFQGHIVCLMVVLAVPARQILGQRDFLEELAVSLCVSSYTYKYIEVYTCMHEYKHVLLCPFVPVYTCPLCMYIVDVYMKKALSSHSE